MPGWRLSAAPALSESLDRYTPIRPIGDLGTVQIWLAHSPHAVRQVAIKLVSRGSDEGEESFAGRRQMLIRSGMAMSRLKHPNITPVYEMGAPEDGVFVAMEYLTGGSLEELFSAKGVLAAAELTPIAAGIARALDYCHETGTIHCDVSPGRILLDGKGGCRLTGFAAARSPGATGSGFTVSLPRSLAFASPEQARGMPAPASDQYSLAAVLYRGLTGVRSFPSDELVGLIRQILTEAPRPASQVKSGLPANVDGVLARAMDVNPDNRFKNCVEFAEAFSAVFSPWGRIRSGLSRVRRGRLSSAR